jgi:plasmid maintenance system antidote protein VapI
LRRGPTTRIREIVKERRAISAEAAARVVKHLGDAAATWLLMQTNYDLKTFTTSQDIEQVAGRSRQMAFSECPLNAT